MCFASLMRDSDLARRRKAEVILADVFGWS
jgi:hypothetical protein